MYFRKIQYNKCSRKPYMSFKILQGLSLLFQTNTNHTMEGGWDGKAARFCWQNEMKPWTRFNTVKKLLLPGTLSFFVPEMFLLHVPDSCRFLNCSVSISIFCHVVWQSWPNHMAEYGNGREEEKGGGGPFHV